MFPESEALLTPSGPRPPRPGPFDLGGGDAVVSRFAARAAELLLTAALLAYPALSSRAALLAIGINYYDPGGNFLMKVHPGTYLLGAAFVAACASRGNPLRMLFVVFARARPIGYFLIAALFLAGYSIVRYGPGGAGFVVDTLVMPAIAIVTLGLTPPTRQRRILWLILGFMTLNSGIGIGEAILQRHLLPYADDEIFRSVGLLSHPLASALLTGFVLVASLRIGRSQAKRWLWLAFMLLSLLAFGGRTAFFLTLVALFGYALLGTLRNLVRGHYSYRQITGGLVLAVLFVTAVVSAALTSDLGNRIFGTLAREESARARWTAWRCLAYLRGDELAFGIPPEQITRIVEELGLVAIENFWLGYLLQFGVVGFVAFASGLFAALGWLFRRTTTEGRLALVLFLVVASSNNSLAAKSCALTVVAAVVIGWRSVADERAAYLKRASRLYPA